MPAPKKNLSGKVLKKILSSMPKPETGGKIGKQLDNVLKTQTKNLTKRNELIKEVNSAKANARGLKAAQGKSLAPKRYKPDTAGRGLAKEYSEPGYHGKNAGRIASGEVDDGRKTGKIKPAPKNKGK